MPLMNLGWAISSADGKFGPYFQNDFEMVETQVTQDIKENCKFLYLDDIACEKKVSEFLAPSSPSTAGAYHDLFKKLDEDADNLVKIGDLRDKFYKVAFEWSSAGLVRFNRQ